MLDTIEKKMLIYRPQTRRCAYSYTTDSRPKPQMRIYNKYQIGAKKKLVWKNTIR